MRRTRQVARAFGWVLVALIAYHAGRGASQTERAATDGNWGHATELAAITLIAAAITIASVWTAVRSARARRGR